MVIGTAGGFSLFLEGVKYIGPVKGTLIGCLEPASATVLSALCLGTHFGAMELMGFCAIMATVFMDKGLGMSGNRQLTYFKVSLVAGNCLYC